LAKWSLNSYEYFKAGEIVFSETTCFLTASIDSRALMFLIFIKDESFIFDKKGQVFISNKALCLIVFLFFLPLKY
jgi:hypothetical protein